MVIDRLTRDEQAHDLRRALEDQVDAEVAHRALDRNRLLPARLERLRRLVATTAADLQRVVDDAPARLGVVQLCDRGLEPDVVPAPLVERGRQLGHRFHRERVRRHARDLLRDRLVLADRLAPLHALVGPVAHDAEQRLADAGAARPESLGDRC